MFKFGFTRHHDNLSLEIRKKRMTRIQAIKILKGIESKKPIDDIKKFCRFTNISINQFFKICEKFRNKKIWKKHNNSWKLINDYDLSNRVSSIIGIIGSFNLPIIKYSVDWWNTLHQPSSITLTSAPTIHHSMLVPLIIMILGLFLYSIIIFLIKYKA